MSILIIIFAAQATTPAGPAQAPPPPIVTVPPQPSFNPRSATPASNPGNWATPNDYPVAALREEREGMVGFRLTIGPDGRVSDCTITASSGSADLDAATCALATERAHFRPATDARGNPTQGSYSSRMRWVIPKDSVTIPFFGADGRFQAMSMTFRFFIEPDGSTSDCVLITNNTAETLSQPKGPCVDGVPYKPFLDAKGKPVRKRVSVTISSAVEDPPQR